MPLSKYSPTVNTAPQQTTGETWNTKRVNLRKVLEHLSGRAPWGVLGRLEWTYPRGGPRTQNTLPRLPGMRLPSWLAMQLASVPMSAG